MKAQLIGSPRRAAWPRLSDRKVNQFSRSPAKKKKPKKEKIQMQMRPSRC
jgi:hypothetical protein